MSADNGIYILVSPKEKSKDFEYRIAYALAIDNINFYPVESKEYAAMEVVYFGKSKVYSTREKALSTAFNFENGRYTEYGVCLLPVRPKPFSKMSLEDAKLLTR